MTTDSTTLPFDASALTDPIDPAALRAWRAAKRASGSLPSGTGGAVGIIGAVVGGIVLLAVLVPTFASVIGALVAGGGRIGFAAVFLVVPLAVLALIVGGAIAGVVGRRRRWYRLDRFAAANGMSFVPRVSAPVLPGMIFGIGGSRESTDLLRGERPRFVEFANYRYTTGSGKNRTTHRWGYVAIRLDVPLPNIVLDATSNNGLFGSNLPASFDRHQRLHLEGDFDRHFSLYCPEGYEQDALYLFTPDIMARFIDDAAALDAEIVDDWLFLYGRRDLSTLDPATWSWLFSTVHALLDKFGQWARWRDDRLVAAPAPAVPAGDAAAGGEGAGTLPFGAPTPSLRPPPGVAPQGRRLKRGFSWATVIVIGFVVLWWLLGPLGNLLGLSR